MYEYVGKYDFGFYLRCLWLTFQLINRDLANTFANTCTNTFTNTVAGMVAPPMACTLFVKVFAKGVRKGVRQIMIKQLGFNHSNRRDILYVHEYEVYININIYKKTRIQKIRKSTKCTKQNKKYE